MIRLILLKTKYFFIVHGYCVFSISSIFMNYRENYTINMLAEREKMNPYTIVMVGIPIILSIIASLSKRRLIKWILLIFATAIYWILLVQYVDWSYTHPFNPDDGGPRSMAATFGWLIGIVIVIIPTYFITKVIKWFWYKKPWRSKSANQSL
jgi:hypothetical protein